MHRNDNVELKITDKYGNLVKLPDSIRIEIRRKSNDKHLYPSKKLEKILTSYCKRSDGMIECIELANKPYKGS